MHVAVGVDRADRRSGAVEGEALTQLLLSRHDRPVERHRGVHRMRLHDDFGAPLDGAFDGWVHRLRQHLARCPRVARMLVVEHRNELGVDAMRKGVKGPPVRRLTFVDLDTRTGRREADFLETFADGALVRRLAVLGTATGQSPMTAEVLLSRRPPQQQDIAIWSDIHDAGGDLHLR